MGEGTRSSGMQSDVADQHKSCDQTLALTDSSTTSDPGSSDAQTQAISLTSSTADPPPPLGVPITPYRFFHVAVGLGLCVAKSFSRDLDWAWGIVAFFMAVLAIKSAIKRTSHRARLSHLLADIPSTIMSAVGKFNTTEVRAWQNPATETHKSITFSKPFVVPPGLAIGLNNLDIDGGANVRVTSSASEITNTGFVVHVDSWSDTTLYSAGVSWLEIAPSDLECQHGQFATTDDHPWNAPQTYTSRRINFARPYATPPKVISFLTSFDMARGHGWRVITKVTDIDKKGFTIHIDTWSDTLLYLGRAGWIAYPEDRPFFYSGTANVMDVRDWSNPVPNNSKAIGFGGTQFRKTPSVFFALNSLDLSNGRNLRLSSSVDNVSTSGLTWHIDTWGDSVLSSAGISYIAFCDSTVPVGEGGGTRHDKKPLSVVDWASVITVSLTYGMQRVLNLAYNKSDQQNTQSDFSRAGAGFDRATYGLYFLIREKGTTNHLVPCAYLNTEGVQLQLWPLQGGANKSQIFFIDSSGALCHAASGLAVDIVDDVPVLRRRRPVSARPNPWSHPLPEFSFVNSQIRVKFLSDPSLPGCTDDMYPDDSWATKKFFLAAHTEKEFHMHPISDFSPWIPAAMVGSIEYRAEGNHDKEWRVLVEERTEDVGGKRTSWEIVPASKL